LRNNKINSLPETISSLPLLQKLYLGNNSFRQIPYQLRDCKRLELIDFSDNQIAEGLESILNSTSISSIYLKNNSIKHFPFHLIKKNKIKELNLMDNDIINFPKLPISVGKLII
jgi:Leucine-rich repeat (LRR) protein